MKELRLEADRCLLCKNARCKANCPISTEIPEVIRLFKEGKLDEAGEILFENNPLSAVCAIVCPHEDQCKGNCIRGRAVCSTSAAPPRPASSASTRHWASSGMSAVSRTSPTTPCGVC